MRLLFIPKFPRENLSDQLVMNNMRPIAGSSGPRRVAHAAAREQLALPHQQRVLGGGLAAKPLTEVTLYLTKPK